MAYVIDHVFVMCSPGAPEASAFRGPDRHSEAARAAQATGLVTFPAADGYVMTLGFDGEVQGWSTDLRPDLPLVLAW